MIARGQRHRSYWRRCPLSLVVLLAAGFPAVSVREAAAQQVLDGALHHLGTPGKPEWAEFAAERAEGQTLTVRFDAHTNASPATLLLRQRGVKLSWDVRLNGRLLGRLLQDDTDLVHVIAVPAQSLRDGVNLLEIGSPAGDDIVVGEFALDARPIKEAIAGARLDVRVSDRTSGKDLPCRLTLVDARGVLAPVAAAVDPHLALRPGVAYTADGRAALALRPGSYTLYATRGFEYGLAAEKLELVDGQTVHVQLELAREVDTRGLIACDTHVHTREISGHGDASLDERLVTLAGEGVELPIATEHDRLADYAPTARRLGVDQMLTPVIGAEVTTRRGHFNAFPFPAGQTAPDATIGDWTRLFAAIRATDSARIVVLNHPRDIHAGFVPFAAEHFNSASGALGPGVGFDAVEIVNSGAMQSDPMRPVRDWFALWNRGLTVTAVGASDSHDVARFIVGQARTYLACADDEPGRIDVNAACRSLREGRGVISLGLLARLSVNGKFQPGDLATGLGETMRVEVRVDGPSWTQADHVELYANGIKIREQAIADRGTAGEKARVAWTIPRPSHDQALVAVASGPGVTAPYWPVPRPYQPTSPEWVPRVLAIANPVRIDSDGDGAWSSPRYYAQLAIELAGTEPTVLFPFLSRFDEAVATQAAAFCLPPGGLARHPAFAQALDSAPEAVRRGFEAYDASLARH